VKPAFLAYLDEGSVLFRPRAVAGRTWMEGHPEPAVRLAWSPSFVQVASAGDLGYTTGPYEITMKDPNDPYAVYGRFVTVWRRRAGGPWRVALDIGVATPKPKPGAGGAGEALAYGRPLAAVRTLSDHAATADNENAEKGALLKADRVFGAEAAAGAAAAYAAHAADGAQLLRSDGPPAVGIQAIRAALAASPLLVTWQPAEAGVSRSGDLGYVYGTADFGHEAGAPARPAAYLRIWERAPGGEWKIALDLLDPLPPPPPEVPG
jgi:ketosteroid isomerase-like protein